MTVDSGADEGIVLELWRDRTGFWEEKSYADEIKKECDMDSGNCDHVDSHYRM